MTDCRKPPTWVAFFLEGTLKEGASVYDEKGSPIDDVPGSNPIRISGVANDRYLISWAGGGSGYINQKDFLPGPFINIVDLTTGEAPDQQWLM